MQIGTNESQRHREPDTHCRPCKSEVWGIFEDAGLSQGHGVEWLFDHLDMQVEQRT